MCDLGSQLKQTRESQGRSLSEMAAQLSLRRSVLEALEDCRFDQLPEAALTRGYLRSYALALGLDPQPLLAQFPAAQPVEPPPPMRRRASRLGWVLGTLLLALIAAGAGWVLYRPTLQPEVVPQVEPAPAPVRLSLRVLSEPVGARVFLDGFLLGITPVEAQVEAGSRTLRLELKGYQPLQTTLTLTQSDALSYTLVPQPQPPADSAKRPTPAETAPTVAGERVVIILTGRSWVRITDTQGKILYEGIAAVGTRLAYPGTVIVRAGNAAAVQAIVDGQKLGPLGVTGEVVTRTLGISP
jgi:cytoskeleton protein RodZ